MAFGKKRTNQTETSRQNERDSIQQNVHLDTEVEATGEDEVQIVEPTSTRTQEKNDKPLFSEVTIIGAGKGTNPGGNIRWSCNHCKKTYSSSYTRIHQHFFGAPAGKKSEISRCSVMLRNRDELQRLREKVKEAEVSGISPALTKSKVSEPKPTMFNPIATSFGIAERHQVDVAIVRGLAANGIPFNVLRNPDFIAMLKMVNQAPKDYKPPSYDRARTSLLDECQREVEKELAPIKDTWTTQGTSIISDGWTNIKRQPLINVMASNSRGSTFLYAENFSGQEKTGKAISEFLLKSIDEVGPSNVLQVVTDNAANCKAAGKEIEKVHKHIFWSPCAIHTLNLIFKDFGNTFAWMSEIYRKGKNIVKYFLNHDSANAIFRMQSGLELLKVAKTRFASHYILLKRLTDCREALATTVVCRSWKEWIKTGDENLRKLGAEVEETICDRMFWDEVDNILTITKPIYVMIKFADGEGQKMGELYERMDCMIGEISDIMKDNKHSDDAEKAMHRDIHLFPSIKQYFINFFEEQEVRFEDGNEFQTSG